MLTRTTTTTPESRARIAYAAFLRGRYGVFPTPAEVPLFDGLTSAERAGWVKAANTIWDLATTGQATI